LSCDLLHSSSNSTHNVVSVVASEIVPGAGSEGVARALARTGGGGTQGVGQPCSFCGYVCTGGTGNEQAGRLAFALLQVQLRQPCYQTGRHRRVLWAAWPACCYCVVHCVGSCSD